METKTPKPCPSCGGPEIGEFCPDDYIDHHDTPFGDLWQCACECGLSTAFCSTRGGAIAQWNMLYQGAPADVARQADAEAHPWGEPGAVPTEPKVWVWAPGLADEPYAAVVLSGVVMALSPGDPSMALDTPSMRKARFRPRWTLAAPEVKR